MPGSNAPLPAAQVVVLDSNVWIDILVFDDPATRPIRAALEHGTLTAVIDGRCLRELEWVLDYPLFSARQIDKSAVLAAVARMARHVAPGELQEMTALPVCRDRDDQKFLELAYGARADWLISKDRALLKLGRSTARRCGFRIDAPGPFVRAVLAENPPAAADRLGAPV
jgi:putative PIN family toxin of toxin-antitoxin system